MNKKILGCLFLCTMLMMCVINVNALNISECDNKTYYLNTSQLILSNWYTTTPSDLVGVNITLYKYNYYTLVNILTSCEVAPQSFDITVYQKLADGSTSSSSSGGGGWYNYTQTPTQQDNDSIIKGDNYTITPNITSNCSGISCGVDIIKDDGVKIKNKDYSVYILGIILLGIVISFFVLRKIFKNKVNIKQEVK